MRYISLTHPTGLHQDGNREQGTKIITIPTRIGIAMACVLASPSLTHPTLLVQVVEASFPE
ncbi:MAG: hypothetical protein F6K26_42260 [Moorea sp. SIO2I5]|nr:hypothetical protein [Moorena sp. SIO2I5]